MRNELAPAVIKLTLRPSASCWMLTSQLGGLPSACAQGAQAAHHRVLGRLWARWWRQCRAKERFSEKTRWQVLPPPKQPKQHWRCGQGACSLTKMPKAIDGCGDVVQLLEGEQAFGECVGVAHRVCRFWPLRCYARSKSRHWGVDLGDRHFSSLTKALFDFVGEAPTFC